jgi:5-methylcytosine-specific restriction endonuclease McrA
MKAEQPWCTYCGSPATRGNDLTIDHIVPLTRGGTNRRENKTVACRRCNSRKRDALIEITPKTTTEDPPFQIA